MEGPAVHSVHRPGVPVVAFAGCVVLAALVMTWRYVGFQSSDDASYLEAGLRWIDHFPYVGDSHWSLRHPVALPIAAAVTLFGVREIAVSLPAILYFVGTFAVNIFFASRFIGLAPAVGGTLLLATLPGFVVLATYMNADLVELFYMTVAFWTFVHAVEHPDRRWPLVGSGAAAGLGFLTRETSAAFVIFVGLLFLFRPMMPRRNYFVIGAAFAAVIGVEWAYLTLMTGDPLYRLHIDREHDTIDRAAELAWSRQRGSLIDAEGNVSVSIWLDPFLNLLITQKYGLLFWAGIPAAVLLLARPAPPVRTTALRLMLLFATLWFAFVAFSPKLYLVPRYLVVTASFFALAAGWGLAEAWRAGRRLDVVVVAAALLAVNLVALMVENVNPRFAERRLVDVVLSHPGETVFTDPNTERHADHFLRFRDMDTSRVSHDVPGPGALVLYNPESIARCLRTFRCEEKLHLARYTPRADWRRVGAIEAPRSPAARIVEALSLQRFLPVEIARKITRPVPPIALYRVPEAAAERR